MTARSFLRSVSTKEPVISAGTASQYWRGDKVWSDLATVVRSAVLTGLSLATSTAITAADTVLSALGKLQSQISLKANIDNPQFTTRAIVSGTMTSWATNALGDTTNPGMFEIRDTADGTKKLAFGNDATNDESVIQSIKTGTGVKGLRINPSGGPIKLGNPSMAPGTMANGCPYIPTIAGSPLVAPTIVAGMSPLIIDTTNNKLWVFYGGGYKSVTFT